MTSKDVNARDVKPKRQLDAIEFLDAAARAVGGEVVCVKRGRPIHRYSITELGDKALEPKEGAPFSLDYPDRHNPERGRYD